MRDNVLWRKKSVIIMMLAKELRIAPERALDLFYSTDVCRQLSDPRTGLQLMSDGNEGFPCHPSGAFKAIRAQKVDWTDGGERTIDRPISALSRKAGGVVKKERI